MAKDTKRTLAYLCPSCRQSVIVERSIFQLAAAPNVLPCPCGKSALRVELEGSQARLSVPCLFCQKEHTVVCSAHAFLHEKALAYGVKLSGATVHFVSPECDGGPIVLQKAVEVLPDDTPEVLQRRIMEQCEWKLLPQAVSLFCQDRLSVEGRTVRILEK